MPKLPDISRRSLLIGGGAGVGLVLAWGIWPRHYRHNLTAAPGESVFNAFLKISKSGNITVIVPQAEMGQGVYTSLPQILADELGADWRTIAVEPAPINALYANDFLIREGVTHSLPAALQGVGNWAAREIAYRNRFMVTGGSSSIRGFAERYREAGAAARALLCMAAAKRWDADWHVCDTDNGFVTRGEPGQGQDRLRFAELVADAATLTPPDDVPLRPVTSRKIVNTPVPRLDLPAKVDGSAQYALDVRLPGMVFASVRHPPLGGGTFKSMNRKAAEGVAGVISLCENPLFVACVAETWWSADQALDRCQPQWTLTEKGIDSATIALRMKDALDKGDGGRVLSRGDASSAFGDAAVIAVEYRVGFAPHAAMEPMNATARVENDRLEIWMPTQAPAIARAAIARATDFAEDRITIYPMLIGGGFGRKVDTEAAVEAAILAIYTNRPVQLIWPRGEDIGQNRCRPPALARMRARIEPNSGIPVAWQARIAVPATMAEVSARFAPGQAAIVGEGKPSAGDVDGAMPPYAIPAVAVDHHPVDVGVGTSMWRSVSHSFTAFFTECFIDELAVRAKMDPMSFRMQLLGDQPRLAQCLSLATAHGGWDGGQPGSGQGIACHSSFGSHVAMLVEVHVAEDQRVIVDKVTAAVDCGQVIHPDIVRQQIEGGIIWGIAGALGCTTGYDKGAATATNFDSLSLPILPESPEIAVHIVPSQAASGGVGEIAVPPVAPAIANALFAAIGKRVRNLPLIV